MYIRLHNTFPQNKLFIIKLIVHAYVNVLTGKINKNVPIMYMRYAIN